MSGPTAWGQELTEEAHKRAWAAAAWIAAVTGQPRRYIGPFGLQCTALPVQHILRDRGVRQAIIHARAAGTACFLPLWLQVVMALQDRARAAQQAMLSAVGLAR